MAIRCPQAGLLNDEDNREGLNAIPADELANAIRMVLRGTRATEPLHVAQWLAELQIRPDANTPEIQRAIDICKDYLDEVKPA